MKKFLMLNFLLISKILLSHPPSDIKVDFDLENRLVKVVVPHKVKNPNDHYIYELKVTINNKKIIEQYTKQQFDNNDQKFFYIIPELKEGDEISIFAECNKFGKLTKKFIAQNLKDEK